MGCRGRAKGRARIAFNRCRHRVPAVGLLALIAALLFPAAVSATALPSTIKENMTLTEAGSPYTGSEVTIESGVTVKAQPGTTIKVSKMIVNGTLKAEGTAEKLIVFTSSKLLKGPGDWKNIIFKSGSGASILEYTEVRYAGTNTGLGAVEITGGASPTVTHCTILENKYYGVKVTEGGSPIISYNTIKSNNSTGISYSAGSKDTGTVNIHDNLVENSLFAGITVSIVGSGVSSTSLGDNELIGNGHEGLAYDGPDIPPDVDENTLSKNKYEYEDIKGTLTQSATWEDRGYPLYLSSEVTISSSATLTLDAGMTVTPYSTCKIVVNGTLNAKGTAEKPVRFTSTKESPGWGDWKNIIFNSGSGSSVLEYAEVRYAGSGESIAAIEIKGGASPTIKHSTVNSNKFSGIKVTEGGSPALAYNTLKNNGNYGISYVAGSTNTGTVDIHDNLAENNIFSGISVSITGSGVSATSLGNNELIKNEQAGVTYTGPDVPPDIDDNTLSENKTNQIEIKGSLVKSGTWKGRGYPFIVSGELIVGPEATLTLDAGFTMKMASTARVVVNGTLNAEGTAENPARVISNKASPSPGDWKNLVFNPGSGGSVFEYAEVSYGGSNTGIGAIEITGGAGPTIKNSTVANNKYAGIKVTEGGSPDIAFNALLSNLGEGISYSAGSKDTGTVNIHDNLSEGNFGRGIAVSVVGEGATSTSVGDNVLVKNDSSAISYGGPDIPTDLDENTLSGNKYEMVEVQGTVAKSASWHDRGFPFYLSSEFAIASAGALTLGEGMTMSAYGTAQIVVNGTLKTEGTSNDPVLFTSSQELGAGDWKDIVFNSGSGSSVLDHAVIRNAGSGTRPAIEVNGASPTITHSALRQNANVAIKVTSGSPKITWNSFTSNGDGLTYSGEGKLSALHNYWGCASGPSPAGCGNSVSENVEWKPQAEEDSGLGQCRGKESQCGEGADPVSLATGALNYSHRDLRLTNKSRVPLQFVRTYNSADSSDSGLGQGWSQSGLANATELENGDVLVRRQDGRQDIFEKTESGYKAPSGITDKLSKVEGNFRLTTLQNTVYAFAASGRINQFTDDHGLKTTYGYNGSGLLTTITDPSGQTLTLSYNASNHITAVKDSTGREVKFAYSEAGDLEKVTDALGGVTKYAYDGQHRMTSITDPKGNVILKNTYDSEGRITEQKDGLENLWKLKYSAGKTVVTEPQGGKLTYGFDSHDRVTSVVDQLGHETTTVYDGAGTVSEVIQPGGGKWTYGYDGEGNLTSIKDPEGGKSEYEYDAQNHQTGYTDPRGNTWAYEWSKANDLTKITDPAKGETTLTYNEAGQLLSVTDPNKHKTEFSYDSRGNRLSVTDPLGHKTSYEYNSRNYPTSKTLPGLKAESFERDALGDVLTRTTPEGNKTKYTYDANGLRTQITDPAENIWKIERNAMERPTVYTDPLEGQIKISYNGNLRPTKAVNRRGKESTFSYNAANQLTEVSSPEEEDWVFGYDNRGNRSSVIDPRGYETTFEYDKLNRMVSASEPLEVTTKYGYDASGDLTSITDPRGYTTTYGYDKLNRLAEVSQPLEKTTSYGYDAASNRLTKTTAAGTLEYGYDAANRLTSIKSGESTLRSYGYDEANRRTSATDAKGHKIEIGYDNDSRVTAINDGRGQSITRSYNSRGLLTKSEDGRGTIEYGYDKLGRETSLTDPQSKALSFAYDPEGDLTEVKRPSGVTTINVYNEAGRLAETTSKDESSFVLEALKYAYDAEGNITSRKDTRVETETTYAYDKLDRLTEFNPPGEGSTAYGYDKAGNRTEAGGVTYEFNALNQLTKASDGTTYGYDKAGRMISKESEAGKTSYEWDLFDHLAKAEEPGGTASYAYDALERPSERKNGESIQVFHYGDLGDVATYDVNGEGKTTTSYVAGPRGLLEERSAEATSYPLSDAHGDITAITGPTGSVESRQTYDPWGAQLSGPSLEMGFLGAQERRADPMTGLIQMGARSYGPELGGFMTEDPVFGRLGNGTSINRYPYVWDNPLNLYDLDGRCVVDIGPLSSACDTAGYLVSHPREAATNAVNYWAGSDSKAAFAFGPLSILGDIALNPDRASYYLEKADPAQMAATGIAAMFTVGVGGLTAIATEACFSVAPELEALHTCTFIAASGTTLTGTGATVTYIIASK